MLGTAMNNNNNRIENRQSFHGLRSLGQWIEGISEYFYDTFESELLKLMLF